MRWFSMLAIYVLFWTLSAFLVMPFGIRTAHDEAAPNLVPGQTESAPSNFNPRRIVLRATILATLTFALFYANFLHGWVSIDDISLVHPPASVSKGY